MIINSAKEYIKFIMCLLEYIICWTVCANFSGTILQRFFAKYDLELCLALQMHA